MKCKTKIILSSEQEAKNETKKALLILLQEHAFSSVIFPFAETSSIMCVNITIITYYPGHINFAHGGTKMR